MSLIDQINEWLLKKSQVYILEITSSSLRWISGTFLDNRFVLHSLKKLHAEEPYFARTDGIPALNTGALVRDLRKVTSYRFPLERHASIVLADAIFNLGSFQIPAVAVKSGFLPLLEREIHKSTTMTHKDFAVRHEFGEKRDNRVPVHYCAIHRNFLDDLKNVCNEAGIVPLSIQPGFTGYSHLLKSAAPESRHPSIFLHFDRDALTAGIYNREGLRAVHVINTGLNDLLRAVMNARQCSQTEAFAEITTRLVLLEDPNSDAQTEIDTYRMLEAVFSDLLQKIYGFLLLYSNDHPDESGFVRIVLSGEGTRIRNIDKLVSANLGIPAFILDSEIEPAVSSLSLPESETPATLTAVLGNLQMAPWRLERFDRIMAS